MRNKYADSFHVSLNGVFAALATVDCQSIILSRYEQKKNDFCISENKSADQLYSYSLHN